MLEERRREDSEGFEKLFVSSPFVIEAEEIMELFLITVFCIIECGCLCGCLLLQAKLGQKGKAQ